MKKIAFIGGYDKTNLILYIAKILTVLGKKVLFVDTTLTKKTKYVLPKMGKGVNYITTFERIDIAIGFETLEQIEKDCADIEKAMNYYLDIDNLSYEAVENAFGRISFLFDKSEKHPNEEKYFRVWIYRNLHEK